MEHGDIVGSIIYGSIRGRLVIIVGDVGLVRKVLRKSKGVGMDRESKEGINE